MNDIESRLAEALAARAADVEPHDQDDALNRISERVTMSHRRTFTILAVAAAVVVAAGTVAFLSGDDDKKQAVNIATDSSDPTTTASTTPTTVVRSAGPTPIWPFASDQRRIASAADAARSFAIDYLGMTNAVVGDSNGLDVQVFPNERASLRTIVHVVEDDTKGFVVVGASADMIEVDTPVAHDPLSSSLAVSGRSLAFEAQINLELRPYGSTSPVFEDFTMGGGSEVLPFSTTITPPSTDEPLVLVVFEGDASGEGAMSQATVIPLAAGSSESTEPPTPTTTRERTPEEAIDVHIRSSESEYAGPCDEAIENEEIDKYCSRLYEDRGTTRIYSAGIVFSEFDTWLLLTHGADGWTVTDAASAGTVDEPQPPPW